MANQVDFDEQSPGGSMETVNIITSEHHPENIAKFGQNSANKVGTAEKFTLNGDVNDYTTTSRESTPGRSSNSNSSRTRTSEGSLPRRSFSRDCYNSSGMFGNWIILRR